MKINENSDYSLIQSQKNALVPFQDSLEYATHFNPKNLDHELAKITDKKKKSRKR